MLEMKNKERVRDLPLIPDKLYFSISEAGKLCALEPHVLRYWEKEFAQLQPLKRFGNHRYYQRKDIVLIREIKQLLYEDGYTIEGARAFLAKENKRNSDLSALSSHERLRNILSKLEDLLVLLEQKEI